MKIENIPSTASDTKIIILTFVFPQYLNTIIM